MPRDYTSAEAFESLVREHQSMVFRTLARMTGNAKGGALIEDLAQEVFLRLYRALPEFRGDSTLSTYLYRIAINVAQDEWKRRRKERTYIIATPEGEAGEEEGWLENFAGDSLRSSHARTPEQLLDEVQMQHDVEQALLELPAQERAVLVLYHQEECSYEGIAATLNLPINTVRTHLHRGRKRLSEAVRAARGALPGEEATTSSGRAATKRTTAGKAVTR